MRKFGLIGYPLGHSFSKKYFTDKFLLEQIKDCSYNNYPISNLSQLYNLLLDPELEGLNVTIPYKYEILKYLDKTYPEAKSVGAVNVIKIKRNSDMIELTGFNSDIIGIRDTLIPVMNRGICNALVFGTGGSSRAVCYVLEKLKVSYKLVSRSTKPGCLVYSEVSGEILKKTDILINTTPLGMFPEINGYPEIDYSRLSENQILFDLVYNPEITQFLKKGQERGCTILTGMKMLISQAERSWRIWNNDSL